MKNRDIEKLMASGFKVIRIEYNTMCIKMRSLEGSWKVLEKNFGSRTALNTRFSELLEHPKNIEL